MNELPFLGEIRAFPSDLVPTGWVRCDGALLDVDTHRALFALLGTTYGGDGVASFGLPDLRGRVPVQADAQRGMSLGRQGGEETHTLTIAEMPAHRHQAAGGTGGTAQGSPAGATWGTGAGLYGSIPGGGMGAGALSPAGGNLPHANLQPYLVIEYFIAVEGEYPPRA